MISLFVNNKTSSNKIISALGNQTTVNLNPSITLDDNKKYQLRLLSFNCVYCMPNVTTKNNTLTYTFNSNTHSIIFDTGLYSLDDINMQVSLYTEISNNGNDASLIQFFPDQATSKIYIQFSQANVIIDNTITNSIMDILGFSKSNIGGLISPGIVKSGYNAQLNAIQNILIKCDITTGSYSNSQLTNIISAIVPDVDSYSTIIYRPVHPVRCPINVQRIESITITLVDQDGKDLDLGTDGGILDPELWSVVLSIEEINMAGLL